MNEQAGTSVLITIISNKKVLDAGSGIILGHRQEKSGWETCILTCRHNLRACEGAMGQNTSVAILVDGASANLIDDPKLKVFDLAILTVNGKVGVPALWSTLPMNGAACQCCGYSGFFKNEYAHRVVAAETFREFQTSTPDGEKIDYLELQSKDSGEWFEKGMSGGPVRDSMNQLVGVIRIRDAVEKIERSDGTAESQNQKRPPAYAIRLTDRIMSIVQQVAQCKLDQPFPVQPAQPAAANVPAKQGFTQKLVETQDAPPMAEAPKQKSIEKDDIQKNRWGGKDKNGPFNLHIERVDEYSKYFEFDAIVESVESSLLEGPFIFHLHDTYTPSVIWVRKTDGKRAGLYRISADGVYTIGVQFKAAGEWKMLEFDLAKWKKGRLQRKYPD
jgi:Trypsin-like peptidase domain